MQNVMKSLLDKYLRSYWGNDSVSCQICTAKPITQCHVGFCQRYLTFLVQIKFLEMLNLSNTMESTSYFILPLNKIAAKLA